MTLQKIGRYKILHQLEPGEDVFLGEGPGGYRVVIRTLAATSEADRDTILEEARRVAALSHPNIPSAQIGLDGDLAFIATEHNVAESFADWLKGRPSSAERVRFVASFADALCHAHEQGVVHGNLTPSSIEVGEGGECALSGFSVGGGKSPVAGLAPYLAPEILQGGKPSTSADVFSAAILICEALAGKHPFGRSTPAAVKEAILNEQPTVLGSEVPRDLAEAVMACLEKDPEWRPKDLTYVAEIARKSAPPGAKPIGKPAPAKAPPPDRPASVAAPAPSLPSLSSRTASRPSRFPMVAAGLIGIAVAGTGAWYFLRPTPSTTLTGAVTPTTLARTASPGPVSAATPGATPIPLPTNGGGKATPTPVESAPQPAPSERASEPPIARPTATPVFATPPPATPAPTPAVVETRPTPTPAPVQPTSEPISTTQTYPMELAALRNVTPTTIRHGLAMIDVHGNGLRSDHKPFLIKGKEVAKGITVKGMKLVNPNLLQVMLQIDPTAPTGAYLFALTDSQGVSTNSVKVELAK